MSRGSLEGTLGGDTASEWRQLCGRLVDGQLQPDADGIEVDGCMCVVL